MNSDEGIGLKSYNTMGAKSVSFEKKYRSHAQKEYSLNFDEDDESLFSSTGISPKKTTALKVSFSKCEKDYKSGDYVNQSTFNKNQKHQKNNSTINLEYLRMFKCSPEKIIQTSRD